jgi:hypothetical protein
VRREPLPDGGIFHQLTPTALVEDKQAAIALRDAVCAHFTRAGLTFDTDYGTRSLRVALQATSAASHHEADATPTPFLESLAELLGTTLVLADGTHVKVVALDWEALSPQEGCTAGAA